MFGFNAEAHFETNRFTHDSRSASIVCNTDCICQERSAVITGPPGPWAFAMPPPTTRKATTTTRFHARDVLCIGTSIEKTSRVTAVLKDCCASAQVWGLRNSHAI